MTIDDFDIVVSTIPESDRLERLFSYLSGAGLSRFMLHFEPKYTQKPPIPMHHSGDYGCSQHFCEIQAMFAPRNLLYLEDDAILKPDFQEELNQHLAELPNDWQIFAAGYIWCTERNGENQVTEHIRRNAQTLCGTQCLLLRAGEWRNTLANDMRQHWLYGYKRCKGFDMNLVPWCRATKIQFYFAAKSFVGQGACVSLTTGKRKRRLGL